MNRVVDNVNEFIDQLTDETVSDIILGENISLHENIDITRNVNIDLNEHTLSIFSDGSFSLSSGSQVKLAGGTIKANNSPIVVEGPSTFLSIQEVNIESTGSVIILRKRSHVEMIEARCRFFDSKDSCDIIVEGFSLAKDNSSFKLYNSSIESEHKILHVSKGGSCEIEMSDLTCTSDSDSCIYVDGARSFLRITSGSFKSSDTPIISSSDDSKIEIHGGTFVGQVDASFICEDFDGHVLDSIENTSIISKQVESIQESEDVDSEDEDVSLEETISGNVHKSLSNDIPTEPKRECKSNTVLVLKKQVVYYGTPSKKHPLNWIIGPVNILDEVTNNSGETYLHVSQGASSRKVTGYIIKVAEK